MSTSKRNARRENVERGLYIKSGIYQACATDASGKTVWKSLGAVNLSEARRLRDEFVAETRGTVVNKSKATMGEVAAEWLAEQERLSGLGELAEGTLRNHEEAWRLHIAPSFERRLVQSITADDLVAWHHAQMTKTWTKGKGKTAKTGKLSTWTIRRHWITLRGILGYAARKGYCAANVADSLTRREVPKNGEARMRILSEDEIKALMARVELRYSVAVKLALFAGLRIGELGQVRWRDVDLKAGTLSVSGQVKTKAGHRTVNLPDFLTRELVHAKVRSPFSGDVDYVIASEVGTPLHERNLRDRGLGKACREAGLEDVDFHSLRHTFASILIADGQDAVYVADQMGHADPSITYRVYAKLFRAADHAKKHKAAMDRAFGKLFGQGHA